MGKVRRGIHGLRARQIDPGPKAETLRHSMSRSDTYASCMNQCASGQTGIPRFWDEHSPVERSICLRFMKNKICSVAVT